MQDAGWNELSILFTHSKFCDRRAQMPGDGGQVTAEGGRFQWAYRRAEGGGEAHI